MAEESLRALLHSTEFLKTLLQTVIIQPAGSSEGIVQGSGAEDTRILAIVAHKSDPRSEEEGSNVHGDATQNIDIENAFPLTGDFSISVAQTKQKLPSHSSPLSSEKTTTGFILTIDPGYNLDPDIENEPMSFLTSDVKQLRHFLSDCRALVKVEDEDSEDITVQSKYEFQWLLPYTLDRRLPRFFGDIPEDLRMIKQPLHTRLSPAIAGLPGDDVADFRLIRDEWIRTNAREASRTGEYRLRLKLGTFNVNGKLPSQDLSGWVAGQIPASTSTATAIIPPLKNTSPISFLGEHLFSFIKPSLTSKLESSSSLTKDAIDHVDDLADHDPDLLVLGFQELDLSTEALVYSTGTAREDAWCQAVFAALGEKGDLYEKVKGLYLCTYLISKQLVGMLIVIIAKKTLLPCFSNVATSSAAAGIMGVLGNKGATAVRLTFTPPPSDSDKQQTSSGPSALTFVNSHLAAFDEMYDKRNLDFQDLSKRLRFETGLVALKKASRDGRAFTGFTEHPITHLPTYRFSPGLETDSLGYDTKRKPAWTDRILSMTGRNVRLRQLSYTGHTLITMSDHRPIAADFVLSVDMYDKDVHSETCRKLCRTAARMEGFSTRVVKLDTTSIDMGAISYNQMTTQTLSLQNTGKGPCAFRFVPLAPDSAAHPEWLRVEPMQAIVLPGEYAYITISSHVDNQVASKLNTSEKALETILILHTILGKDHFISVTAEYQYTCFANSLSRLTRLPGPISSLKSPDDLRSHNQPINAPREIMRLVNWMMSDYAHIDGLFTSPGEEVTTDTIRECLDTGDEFPFSQEHADPSVVVAFGETLLRLLDSITDSVVPFSLHPKCVQVASRDEAFEVSFANHG
ncbi:hypothetical protein DXG01_001114 [Tephrocybe rancida]|nr:hypothetical protein DXG01_001114 [Tephrocybe rancida]